MAPPFLRRGPTCFFCLSVVSPAPPDARSYRCPHCGCSNRYDARGEISSDEPAMHDEKLNARSFAKRASPNKDRLPPIYGSAPFCHTCQTNQMLLVNLLSNYLPPPQHPDYAQRLEKLPAYRESLHVRYPPVCAICLPAVEDEIEQKNQMARTKALGGWLGQSRGKERQRSAGAPGEHRDGLGLHLAVWRIKGVLWWFTLLCIVVAHAAAIRGYEFPRLLARTIPVLPALCLFSLSYTAWDPTYIHFKKARIQGRDVRIRGKTHYVVLQALSWFSRFATSILLFLPWQYKSWDYLRTAAYPSSHRLTTYCSISFVLELLILASSFTILHQQRPPAIRLVDPSTKSSVRGTPESYTHSARASPISTAPLNNEPDLFASLTLSSTPLVSSVNPMFGHPSLVTHTAAPTVSEASPIEVDEYPDDYAMDWTPTNLSPAKTKKTVDSNEGTWLRPQRFFPPERPTGLENLFANTKLDDGDARSTKSIAPAQMKLLNAKAIGKCAVPITLFLVSLGSVALYLRWTKGWIH